MFLIGHNFYHVFILSTYSRTHVYLCPLVYTHRGSTPQCFAYKVKNNKEKNEENLKESTRDKGQIVIFH